MCYQLQQKRRVLNELKTELEYCRKKWALARALNNESEEQCKQLREEFSLRKVQDQNSAESGYSDEHPSDGDGDDDEAGTSIKPTKVKKFDDNLQMFDRTASPTCFERRHSASPLIHNFTNMCLFSRAQSEPPRTLTEYETESVHENYLEEFEVLDLIPDPIFVRCVVSTAPEREDVEREQLIVSPPPDILVHKPTELKAHLRKHKKRQQKSGKAESAEEMFKRLMTVGNDDKSMCSTCSIDIEEDENFAHESIEEIQEIPFDDPVVKEADEIKSENCERTEVNETEEPTIAKSEQPTIVDPEPQPSTSKDGISALTTKEQEFLQRREARLARLEAESQAFYEKMAKNKEKGVQLNNHLNDIHQTFLDRNREKTKSEGDQSDNEKPKEDETNRSTDEPGTSGEVKKEKKPKNDES